LGRLKPLGFREVKRRLENAGFEEIVPRKHEIPVVVNHSFDVVVEKDEEGYYVASVPALPGCHTGKPSG